MTRLHCGEEHCRAPPLGCNASGYKVSCETSGMAGVRASSAVSSTMSFFLVSTKRAQRGRGRRSWCPRLRWSARLLPLVMWVLSAVALHLDDRVPRRFLCTSRAPWESRTCDVCTSWFLLCWRQHLNVGAVGCGSGQLSASAERSLAWTIGPALIAELSSVPSPSLARGSAPCAFFVSVLVGFFFKRL